MRVVVAPDSMGGLLSAPDLAAAIARGWHAARPDDRVHVVPMSDGGEGLLAAVHGDEDRRIDVEVAGPLGHPVDAWVSLRPDGTAVVESAQACGLARLRDDQRDPVRATTYGVGQLLDAARRAGARRVLVGLGGSATVDGGAGALIGLGFRLRVADGSGLKVGAADLHRVRTVERGWADAGWREVEVELLADVRTPLGDAATRFGPQKGATPGVIDQLAAGLGHWARVVTDTWGVDGLATTPGTGAAGGLGFGLAAALGARIVAGVDAVAELVGLDDALADADVVVTGEGRVDATSFDGKVVDGVLARGRAVGAVLAVVAGEVDAGASMGTNEVEVELAPATTADEARGAATEAGRALARRLGT